MGLGGEERGAQSSQLAGGDGNDGFVARQDFDDISE